VNRVYMDAMQVSIEELIREEDNVGRGHKG
jgi:hypothetical protein